MTAVAKSQNDRPNLLGPSIRPATWTILCFLQGAPFPLNILQNKETKKNIDDGVRCEEERGRHSFLLGCISFAELIGNSTHAFGSFRDAHTHRHLARAIARFHVHTTIQPLAPDDLWRASSS
jgi:hypothetical protein